MPVMPQRFDWTAEDLEQLPDDGLQYELIDGLLLVTPPPIVIHQRVLGRLHLVLAAACTPAYEVFFAPLEWRPDKSSSLQPDLLVVARDRVGVKNITQPLALAVEVLSPSTRRKDLVLKRSKYEDAGVESYWIVDPIDHSVTVLDLVDGHYVQSAHVSAGSTHTAARPFPVRISPTARFAA
jgi:Uma2 family endonuclease